MFCYISELFEYGVHLKFGRFTVVDAESSVFLIAFLVHFLQKKQTKKMLKKICNPYSAEKNKQPPPLVRMLKSEFIQMLWVSFTLVLHKRSLL